MNSKIAYCLILVLGSILVGCGGGLGRKEAARLVGERFAATPLYEEQVIFLLPGIPTPDKLDADTGPLGVLHRLGYVGCETIPARNIYTQGGLLLQEVPETCGLVLTAKGRTASAGWKSLARSEADRQHFSIPVAQAEFLEITGVTEEGTEAVATYTWRQKPINDIGEAFGYGAEQQASARFRKFDDGWRLE